MEENQATIPWDFEPPMKGLHCGIKFLANRGEWKITDLQDEELSLKLLKSEGDKDEEDEENQR